MLVGSGLHDQQDSTIYQLHYIIYITENENRLHKWCNTCVAVVLHNGLKVKRPCSSSNKSSPAALNICSSGVPGNILNDT